MAMTTSEPEPVETPVDMPYGTYEEYVRAMQDKGEVLGVLTGQYPARTMPITGAPPRQDLDGEFLDDDDGSA